MAMSDWGSSAPALQGTGTRRQRCRVESPPCTGATRLVAAALGVGEHVFEKPLFIREADLDDVERPLRDAMRRAGAPLCLMVGVQTPVVPHARALEAAFQERGTPMVMNYRVNAGVVPPESWLHDPEEGGGRIIGGGCHFVDLCRGDPCVPECIP